MKSNGRHRCDVFPIFQLPSPALRFGNIEGLARPVKTMMDTTIYS